MPKGCDAIFQTAKSRTQFRARRPDADRLPIAGTIHRTTRSRRLREPDADSRSHGSRRVPTRHRSSPRCRRGFSGGISGSRAESGVDLAAAHAGELAPRGCVSLGSQAENGDLEAASQGETDRNAARTGGPPRTKLAGDRPSARSRVVPLAGYVPSGRDLLRFAGVLADGRRAAAWLAGGDAQGAT